MASGDDVGVENGGFIFAGRREADESENFRDERAGVILVGIAVRVVDVHGDLRELGEVGDGEGLGLGSVDESERMRGRHRRLGGHLRVHLRHAAGFVCLCSEGEGRD